MHNSLKITRIIFLITAFCLIFCACSDNISKSNEQIDTLSAPSATENFNITVLNTGNSDAIVLKTKEHTVIIDTGNRGDGKQILSKLSEDGINSIDYLFITHFDKDHVGGARKLINNINIDNIVTPRYKGQSEEYRNYIEAAQKKAIKPTELTQNMSFILDDVLFDVFPPQKTSYIEDDNDFSLVISITHGDNKFLFAGDAEEERLKELSSQFDLPHTFLKVPHHGNYNKNTKSFLQNVSPKYSVITCNNKDNSYKDTLSYLDFIGCETYFTFNGNIDITSDGKNINILQ